MMSKKDKIKTIADTTVKVCGVVLALATAVAKSLESK